MSIHYVMVHDENRCIGCQACNVACHSANDIPDTVNRLQVRTERSAASAPAPYYVFDRISCQQCEKPPCIEVCPTQAIHKNNLGIVTTQPEKCIQCQRCLSACPYQIRFINPRTNAVDQCNFCSDSHLARGESPACVTVCPTDALVFGDLSDASSSVRKVLKDSPYYRQKAHLGTSPNLYRIPNRKGEIKA